MVKCPHLLNLFSGNFASAMSLPKCLATFHNFVLHVLKLLPNEQVFRIYTFPIVAVMAHEQMQREAVMVNKIRDTWCPHTYLVNTNCGLQSAITVRAEGTDPIPALIWFCDLDFLPKSFLDGLRVGHSFEKLQLDLR
jgi:hypothetical protein